MDVWKKGILLTLSAALLISLGLTPAARAQRDRDSAPAAAPSAPAQQAPEGGDGGAPEDESKPPEPDWREAATLEELEALLFGGMMERGGHIRVTGDLLVPARARTVIWPSVPEGTPLVVDLGDHTLAVEGELIVRAGIAFTGQGGETGLVRVLPGGSAKLQNVLFTVTRPGGCAVWQEEGGVLDYAPHPHTVGEIRLAPPPQAEAATFGELVSLLEEGRFLDTGGVIRATADLTVPPGTEYVLWPRDPEQAPLTLDLGEHTLAVEGSLTVSGGVEFTGAGGENGLVRVRSGGAAYLSSPRFTVTEAGGYALWQEEGGLLKYQPEAGSTGAVRFARRPVAVPDSAVSSVLFTPVALVWDGQALEDALPAADGARLYRDGAAEDTQLPVEWALEPSRAQLDGRERVLLTGRYPGADALAPPVCLAAFQNGRPAVLLNCYGAQGRDGPSATVQIALARPALGCRFEWSQDGETWLPATAEEYRAEGEYPVFQVSFPQEEPPAYPYYLSAVVEDPALGVGYSDVVVIAQADARCDCGGSRGGGTDITDPPGTPRPDPEPPPAPPEQGGSAAGPAVPEEERPPEAAGADDPARDASPQPLPTPSPEPDAGSPAPQGEGGLLRPAPPLTQPTPQSQASPPPSIPPEAGAAVSPTPEPRGAAAVSPAPTPGPSARPAGDPAATAPAQVREPPGGSPAPAGNGDAAGVGPAAPAPDPLTAAAGCTAVAAVMGAAGLRLYPKAWKRVWDALKRPFKR